MKKILFILLTLLTIKTYAQKEITLDNSLTGMYSQSKTELLGAEFIGNNSINFKKSIGLDLGTNYNIQYNHNLSQNEFIQKANLSWNKEHYDFFTTYQYNYSLSRGILADNWLGIGCGVKENYSWGKMSLSYAFLYTHTDYINDPSVIIPSKEALRHSIRGRIKIDGKLIGISTEYYYQPNINNPSDYIVYGTTKLSIFPKKPLNFIIQDIVNYKSVSNVKMLQTLTFGFAYNFNKKYEK